MHILRPYMYLFMSQWGLLPLLSMEYFSSCHKHWLSSSCLSFQQLQREMETWSRTNHKHVIKCIGYCTNLGPVPCFISPWMENGTAADFIKQNPGADRVKLVRIIIFVNISSAFKPTVLVQLRGIADGLSHLHDLYIVHGDIRAVSNSTLDHHKCPQCPY